MDAQRTFIINGARHEFSTWADPPKIRRMTVSDLQIVFLSIEIHGGTACKVPPNGSLAFSAFATPDFWDETQKVHERRRPRTVTHSIGSSIITGRTSPEYVRRNDVFPATLMTPEMLSAWLERAIIRPVGTFEEGMFVPDGWFRDELKKYLWDATNRRFEREEEVNYATGQS